MILSEKEIERRSRYMALIGWIVMICLYTLVFRLFSEISVLPSLRRAIINVTPAALLSFPILYVIQQYAFGKPAIIQTLIHLTLLLLFSVIWLIGIQVGYGLQDGWLRNGVTGRPLMGVALTWQGLQGILLYIVIALFGYTKHYRILLANLHEKLDETKPNTQEVDLSPTQVIVKDGSKLIPVRLEDIVFISGAGDYSEVVTKSGKYLSSTRLSQFVEFLPNAYFKRVHRSHIVRLDAITAFEPAGNGRLSLFFSGDLSVVTSREGAKAIRDQAV
ncbi:MAG: LytTR family DNA-binding domain-containing protein [Litorimonas sp.]